MEYGSDFHFPRRVSPHQLIKGPITLNGFFRKLRASRKRWYITKDNAIRFRTRQHIETAACPLTAVYGQWESSRLPWADHRDVLRAADGIMNDKVRARLLKACKL